MSDKPFIRHVGKVSLGAVVFSVLFYALYTCLMVIQTTHATPASVFSTIFSDTAPAAFSITTAGTNGAISYTVTDLSGATVLSGQSAVAYAQTNLTLPHVPDGYYVLHITDHTVSSTVTQSIPFAVVAPFTPGTNSPFGVGVHFTGGDNPNLAPPLTTMGAGSIRDDAAWDLIERAPGRYTFNAFDPYMQVLQQNNIDPLLILDYNNRFYDNNQTPYDDAGLTAFANYAKALVSHYGSQLKEVEVYNEYNGAFSTGPCVRKASCYAQMLRYTYQAIKSIRPDMTVVGGAALFADLSWFKQLFQAGALRYMDAISDHPYTPFFTLSPEVAGTGQQMADLETLIKSYNHGLPKPIWITELGWPTSFMHPGEHTQADYLVRSTVLGLAAGVQKFYWYDLLNDGNDQYNTQQNFGLLRRLDAAGRYTPKPSYVAYAVMARKLSHEAFISSDSIGRGIYDMRFTNNLRVLWSIFGHQNIVVSTSHPLTITSMTGRVETYTPSGGQVTLSLSGDPIYMQGNVSSIGWDPLVCHPSCS